MAKPGRQRKTNIQEDHVYSLWRKVGHTETTYTLPQTNMEPEKEPYIDYCPFKKGGLMGYTLTSFRKFHLEQKLPPLARTKSQPNLHQQPPQDWRVAEICVAPLHPKPRDLTAPKGLCPFKRESLNPPPSCSCRTLYSASIHLIHL